ncbi:MAG: pyridoxamine 5'-phosphate oxidase [Gemmatimonadales bacterium]
MSFHERVDYGRGDLDLATTDPDPFAQFARWYDEARHGGVAEPNAMTLATVNAAGMPSARIVLLKGVEQGGFVFFTNYESAKGRDLAANPNATLLFFWQPLERQVRISGAAERVPREESEAYFATRPDGSRLGAWASRQSEVLPDRAALETALAEVTAQFDGGNVPCPPYWGGYRIRPVEFEFWQGRPSRLHDRIRYRPAAGGAWLRERLSP